MYLDCTIKIPDSNGKITKKTIKGTTYIYYEYARIYLKDKKYTHRDGYVSASRFRASLPSCCRMTSS